MALSYLNTQPGLPTDNMTTERLHTCNTPIPQEGLDPGASDYCSGSNCKASGFDGNKFLSDFAAIFVTVTLTIILSIFFPSSRSIFSLR